MPYLQCVTVRLADETRPIDARPKASARNCIVPPSSTIKQDAELLGTEGLWKTDQLPAHPALVANAFVHGRAHNMNTLLQAMDVPIERAKPWSSAYVWIPVLGHTFWSCAGV
jgi:hypothetical protein